MIMAMGIVSTLVTSLHHTVYYATKHN